MNQESTTELIDILKTADKANIDEYMSEHTIGVSGFAAYMDEIIAAKGIKRRDVFQRADLPQKYGYKLLSGESHTTDRDKLLRIFLSIGMTLKEVQRALAMYGLPALYPKFKRDVILIVAINKGVSSVDTVNEWLIEHGENELSRSSE